MGGEGVATPSRQGASPLREDREMRLLMDEFRRLRSRYDTLKVEHVDLLWNPGVLDAAGVGHLIPPPQDEADEPCGVVYCADEPMMRGPYYTVHAGRQRNGTVVALQRVPKRTIKTLSALKLLAAEIEALKALTERGGHEHIVAFLGAFSTKADLYVTLESPLKSNTLRIALRKQLDADFAARVLKGLASGVAFIHEAGVVHRGLSSESVLICQADASCWEGRVLIRDLSQCARVENCPLTETCGYMGYYAPEIVLGGGYDEKVDIWSLGCVVLECLLGSEQFAESWTGIYSQEAGKSTSLKGAAADRFRDRLAKEVSKLAPGLVGRVISHCLRTDPRRRPAASQVAAAQSMDSATLTKTEARWASEEQPSSSSDSVQVTRPRSGSYPSGGGKTLARHTAALSIAASLGSGDLPTTSSDDTAPAAAPASSPPAVSPMSAGKKALAALAASPGQSSSRNVNSKLHHHHQEDTGQGPPPPLVGSDSAAALNNEIANTNDDWASAMKVLVVDDSPTHLFTLTRQVQKNFSCEVHTASSAMDAFSLIERHKFVVVITDMVMPFMDGFEFIAVLRKRGDRVYICAVTSLTIDDSSDLYHEVDIVCSKPFDVEVLAADPKCPLAAKHRHSAPGALAALRTVPTPAAL